MTQSQNLFLVDDTATVLDNGQLSFWPNTFLANDSGEELKIIYFSSLVNGAVNFTQDGQIIFTPNNTFSGNTDQASFKYTVTDRNGNTATATINITVQSTNKAPVARNDTRVISQNTSSIIPIAHILRNDTDPENHSLSLVSVNEAIGGTVATDTQGNIIFNPQSNFLGQAEFQYTVRDSRGATSTAKVFLDVVQSPIAKNDNLEVRNNKPTVIVPSTLLANDSTPRNISFSIVEVGGAVNGTVEFDSWRNIVFTPAPNYRGPAEFSYTIRDRDNLTATARVNVNVKPSMSLGINLSTVSDWSTQLPFIDVFKMSRPWIWEGPYTNITTNIDSNGWLKSVKPPAGVDPKAVATTVFFTDMPNRFPGGRYVVLYDGEGTTNYKYAATKNVALSRPGRDVIDVNPSITPAVFLQITSTNESNYIRNIRVVPEAFESSYSQYKPLNNDLFNPTFMEAIRPFSTVRFMEWMNINGSTQMNWSDRPTLNQAQWTPDNWLTNKGVPVEVMVNLANQGDFNPWFTLPHLATDDYVRNFAQYVKNNLEPDKKVYIEYTNEAWNNIFPQNWWINGQAAAAGITANQWFARRTSEVIQIWKDVFRTEPNRVVGVLATHSANGGLAGEALEYLRTIGGISAIDAIAIAPYFGYYLGSPQYTAQVERMTVNQIFDELTQGGIIRPGGALQEAYSRMSNYAEIAKYYQKELIAYEGGQHIVGFQGNESNSTLTNLFIAVNRDPRMGQIYREYLNKWSELGGGLFATYKDITNPTRHGSWGMMEYLNDVYNPKYLALREIAKQTNLR